MLKELEKNDDISVVKNNLYKIFNNELKEDVDTNLNDLIIILKSEHIVDK